MTTKTVKIKKTKDEVQEWVEAQYRRDPGLRKRVEARLAEMRLEQELVALREARGLSQTDVARRLGVTQPAIAKLESGRAKNFGMQTIVRYVTACGGALKVEVLPGHRGLVVAPARRAAKR